MNPTYFDVLSLLAANGFGSLGVEIFGGEWGAPDKQVLVLEGVGTPSPLKDLYEQPGVQIIVRGDKGDRDIDVYVRAKAVSDFMLSQSDSIEINGVCYKGFEEGSNIAPLGKDDEERFNYSMNFITWRNR
ncbi:MAG: hypothetical protein KAT62_03885 [Desulfuromonadales bacterium]|nr:hypothetical protein [Desulfuromonadales bacterium]